MTDYIANCEKKEELGVVFINNPPMNEITSPDFLDIDRLESWIDKESLKGLVITGVGRNFSTGADKELLYRQYGENPDAFGARFRKGKDALRRINTLPIPVVASISGACFGAGLEIALACHVRICSESAIFAFPEAGFNLMPGFTGTVRLPSVVGMRRSIEMILLGSMQSSAECLEMGLVDLVVPKNELMPRTMEYLMNLVAGRPLRVINSLMKSLHNSRYLPEPAALEEEAKLFCDLVRQNAS